MPARSANSGTPKRPIIFAAFRDRCPPAPLQLCTTTLGSEVFGDSFKFPERRARGDALTVAGYCQAVIDMIVDQRLFRLGYRFLDSMQLLRKVKAGAPLFNHRDHPP
jgi:hypothetical protein